MIDQIGIAVFGVTAIALSQSKNPAVQKWACIAGLVGQPFWFMASWQASQWGIFALSFLYTVAWSRGLWNFWFLPWQAQRKMMIEKPVAYWFRDEHAREALGEE